jgi:hypothetical protein
MGTVQNAELKGEKCRKRLKMVEKLGCENYVNKYGILSPDVLSKAARKYLPCGQLLKPHVQ